MGTSASGAIKAHIRTIFAAAATFMLCLGLAPAVSAADESVAGGFMPPEVNDDAQSASPTSILASTLTSDGVSVISADVLLGDDAASDTVIGSFTVDGLTFALNDDGGVTLVAVSPDVILSEAAESGGVEGSLDIPSEVTYNDTTYPVTAIGPYAFYLSGATQVTLPVSITSVDDRAFRSSDVESVSVDADNPNIASFDGALYSADLTSLLLIPEGRTGVVLLPSETEVVEPSLFSHCSLVEAIDVEEGDAAFAFWDGLLYSADGTTLLRVPAGATDITIREGCTTIAAGAMEGCTKLERINAPSTVTSISPNVFEYVPTISLPANVILSEGTEDAEVERSSENEAEDEAEVSPRRVGSSLMSLSEPLALPDLGSTSASSSASGQLTAMVALTTMDGLTFDMDVSSIKVALPYGASGDAWQSAGFTVDDGAPLNTTIQSGTAYNADNKVLAYARAGGYMYITSNNENKNHMGKVSVAILSMTSTSLRLTLSGANFTLEARSAGYKVAGDARANTGYTFVGWNQDNSDTVAFTSKTLNQTSGTIAAYAVFHPNPYTIAFDAQGGDEVDPIAAVYDTSVSLPRAIRPGYRLVGWSRSSDGTGTMYKEGEEVLNLTSTSGETITFYAQWEPDDFNVSFDTSSEPGDEDYPGDIKPDEVINANDGQVTIEDPRRPGYVFQGWVIPDAETNNKEALDQDLVYQGDDGKWYVDASQLPDYATDGKVELTARWTSIISVDVPSAVTFYADVVTQGNESREGAVSNAFGQSKVANQSQVDLRVVGLESEAVETTDAMLGADSILKKASAATPATSAQKLLSLYPSAKAWTAEELQDPEAVGGAKASTAVDFDLDDLLLEASFAADDFTIPAGDTLNMGYRLNLTETGQELDYDKLSALEDGQSAAIANVSYCFAAERLPVFWTYDGETFMNLYRIKADAEAIAAGDADITAKYTSWMNEDHRFYLRWFDKGLDEVNARTEDESTVYEVRIIGVNHDDKPDGSGKAGITFQLVNSLNTKYPMSNSTSSSGGWSSSTLRTSLNAAGGTLYQQVPADVRNMIVPVRKQSGTAWGTSSMSTTSDSFFLLSMREIWGQSTGSWTEGSRYPYFNAAYILTENAVEAGGTQPLLMKSYNGGLSGWLLRTIASNVRFKAVSSFGACNLNGEYGSEIPNDPAGISPAFCL